MKLSHQIAAVSLSSVLILSGCSQNPSALNSGNEDYSLVAAVEDNSGESIAADIALMAESFNLETRGAAAKRSTDNGSISWQAWTYGGGWWVRWGSVTATTDDGSAEISAIDSVRFLNLAGSAVEMPIVTDLSGGQIHHHVKAFIESKDGAYIEATRDWELNAMVSRSTDTTLTLNGSLSQALKAENGQRTKWCNYEGNATAQNIVYIKTAEGWSKPVSGSVNVESTYKLISVTFDNGTAHVTVSSKDGKVVKDLTVTL